MKATYFGHSCFLLETAGKKILFDPFITGNELAKNIDISMIETDYILISHGHGDHIADAPAIAKRTGAKVVAAYEVCSWLEKQGVTNCHPVNHGGKLSFDFGTVKFTNAVHSSSLPDGSYGGNPMGFVIESKGKTIYYSGDTALTYDMKLVGDFHEVDAAFLAIGDNFTMGIEDAIVAADFVGSKNVVGMHYDTFGYIVINHEEALKAFAEKGKVLTLIEIGKSIEI